MAIDVEDKEPRTDGGNHQPKKPLKRKRQYFTPTLLTNDQKAAQIEALKGEMVELFGYYREMMREKEGLGLGLDLSPQRCSSDGVNGMVGLLLEESDLSFSRLVAEIHEKLVIVVKEGLTVGAVKGAVLSVGHRVNYGVPNVDADVLEDESQNSLWCWETRDMKLVPKPIRGTLKIRRTCRKKIHERITAVSEMITALQKSDGHQDYENDLLKASDKLGKVLREADIRLLVHGMLHKNGTELAEKEAKREEKLLKKQLEKNKREADREKKRMDIELQKEKRQTEKEQKRLQEEAERDERRREKEQSEIRRQLKKQQEEAEKEQRRREREEYELKRRLSVQKQAAIMEQFLKRSKTNSHSVNDGTPTKATTSDSSSKENEKTPEALTQSMDCTLLANEDITRDDVLILHLSSWRHLGNSIRSNKRQHWSRRQKPKMELFKELKLSATMEVVHDRESRTEKLAGGWGEQASDDRLCFSNLGGSSCIRKCNQRKQLLQFDKSHRPPFYGIWPKKSCVVGPRHPFRKEPDLDYDIDSDEEWEEEDPGESLSDCDKDEESLEEGHSKADDEEESEDGFFVPDGYLSENEVVQVDKMETDFSIEEATSCKLDMSEEFCELFQLQKYLSNLTDSALRKNQPMIILNLMHEKVPLLLAEDLTGSSKLEKMCLHALSMRTFSGGPPTEISVDSIQAEDHTGISNDNGNTASITTATALQYLDMPTVVSAIQSCSQSMNKIVEVLQQKSPTVSKSQLKNKIREISDFVDNHWQVKKEILDEVGMSISPGKEKGRGIKRSISTFFSKRCLPPSGKNIDPEEDSTQPSLRYGSVVEGRQVGPPHDP